MTEKETFIIVLRDMTKVAGTRLARRQRLNRLIADLREELAELDRETERSNTPSGRKLTESFFWTSVAPILEHAPERGLPNRDIQKALKNRGLVVQSQAFRLLLNRTKRKGFIELIAHYRGHGGWKLTEMGRERLMAAKHSEG